jgi:nicotinamidase-related amidase
MSRMFTSKVSYDIDPDTTALIGVDFQAGFGENSWEPVPHAASAVENFRVASQAWRNSGGTVVHVRTEYTRERPPTGRIADFAPDIATALATGAPGAEAYPGLAEDDDVVVYKTSFSAVISSDLVDQLRARGIDTAVVGGLTTPICVQTTVDALSMLGVKVVLLHDACASQAIGALSAEDAHDAAVERMAYLFASIQDTETFLTAVRSLPAKS